MGYAVRRARSTFRHEHRAAEDPTSGNALRIKGGGEAGVTSAPAAAVNAVIDARASGRRNHIDTPMTAPKLWQILHAHGMTQPPKESPAA